MTNPTPEGPEAIRKCGNGHDLVPENLYRGKFCRACKADRQRDYRDRHRGVEKFRLAENARQARARARRKASQG